MNLSSRYKSHGSVTQTRYRSCHSWSARCVLHVLRRLWFFSAIVSCPHSFCCAEANEFLAYQFGTDGMKVAWTHPHLHAIRTSEITHICTLYVTMFINHQIVKYVTFATKNQRDRWNVCIIGSRRVIAEPLSYWRAGSVRKWYLRGRGENEGMRCAS